MIVFKNTTENRERLFTQLYLTVFPDVAKHIHKRGGTLDEAKDIFQEALCTYFEKVVLGTRAINTTEKAYIFGISKNLWNDRHQERCRTQPTTAHMERSVEPEDPTFLSHRIVQLLQTAGDKCMQLLKAFYYDKLSLEAIATQYGYSSTRSSTVQKHKCLEKVRTIIKLNSMSYESFVD